MGGGHGDFHALKSDPSIARWSAMRENVFKTFVFNRRTSRIALVWGAIVPVSLYLFMSRGVDVDLAGKTRAESLRKSTPQVAQQE